MFPVLLYIDDRAPLLQIRKTNLERLEFEVVTATNTPAALAILENLHVTAVLLDYKQEGLDAEAVAFHIKQRFPHKPVLLLSAYSDMPERVLWLVDEYILRSDPLDRLVEVVQRVAQSDNSLRREAAA